MTTLAHISMTSLAGIASSYSLWAIGGTIALLALFWLLRGRIRIEKGWGGLNIMRFSRIERLVHWLLAVSLVVLALTGLCVEYGRTLLAPLLGEEVFAEVLSIVWPLYFWVQLPFMTGLVLAFLFWVRLSLPHWRDAIWLLKGGGLIVRGVHPPAHKFNAGQKLLFWLVVLGGAWLSFSLSIIPALVLTCAVMVHVYMRTVGIQGAASAMISGEVDANWARQHHSLWAEQELKRIEDAGEPDAGDTVPARAP